MRRFNIHTFAGLLACFGLLGCDGDGSSAGLGGPDEFITLECDGFFDSGDYSSVCFVDGTTPVYTTDSPASGCIIRVGDRPDSVDDEISVVMINDVTFTVSLATSVFARLKQDAEEEMEGTITDISGVGDEAYIVDIESDFGSFVIIDKNLHVRYRNLLLSFGTGYDTVNQPSCSHTNSELEKFAILVIDNINAQQ